MEHTSGKEIDMTHKIQGTLLVMQYRMLIDAVSSLEQMHRTFMRLKRGVEIV